MSAFAPMVARGAPLTFVDTYVQRCQTVHALLCSACGLDLEIESPHFRRFVEVLSNKGPPAVVLDTLTAMTGDLSRALPLPLSHVLTFAGRKFRGFAYISEGNSRYCVSQNAGLLLAGALDLHLTAGGSPAEAALMVDVFHLAFPEPVELDRLSSAAGAVMVGVVPCLHAQRMKIYYNTRLYAAPGHRDRIASILERLQLEGMGFYDVIFDPAYHAQFHGVGLDLDGDGSTRAKLYVHVKYEDLGALVQATAKAINGVSTADASDLAAEAHKAVSAIRKEHIVPEAELAVALSSDGPPTLKMTLFISQDSADLGAENDLAALFESCGYDVDLLHAVLAAARPSGPESVGVAPTPLKSVGFELPVGDVPKLNVYVRPPMLAAARVLKSLDLPGVPGGSRF